MSNEIDNLRAQIRNDEAMIEVYENWICDHAAGLCATHPGVENVRAFCARLTARRAALAALSGVAAPDSAPAALVTTAAASELPLQTP